MSKQAIRARRPAPRSVVWVTACAYVVLCAGVVEADQSLIVTPKAGSEPPPTDVVAPPDSPDSQLPSTPQPMNPRAKVHYDLGLELYARREFPAAAAELRRGFSIDPRREFLFAEAQALRLSGDCPAAISLYEQFIDSNPPPLQRDAARLGLARCGPERAPPPAPTTARAPTAANPSALGLGPLTPLPPPAARQAWWRDPWAAVSLGAGVAAVGVAVGFAVASNRSRDRATSVQTTTEQEFDRQWESARQQRDIAVTALLTGAVLLVTGGTRLLLAHEREGSSTSTTGAHSLGSPAATLSFVGDSVALAWQGRF